MEAAPCASAAAVAGNVASATWGDLRTKGVRAFVADAASGARERACCIARAVTDAAVERYGAARTGAAEHAAGAAALARAKAEEARAAVHDAAADPTLQVTAASAAGGAVVVGAGSGAAGLVAGGALGAAAGLVPALFTFGLSIPIGAAIGSGVGLVGGAALGGTVGAVGGGAAGYGAYSKREEIGRCTEYVRAKAEEAKDLVKDTSGAAVEYVAETASAARSRLVGGGAGAAEPVN